MNKILNYGFVRPYIQFQFSNGQNIDTIPPRYFSSFHQTRTVDEACSFELTLIYAPGNFNEDTASIIHQLLLSNKNTNVTYRYGYKVKNQFAPICQNQYYSGIFTTYSEDLNDGYLTYTISGVAKCIENTSPVVSISNYINTLKKYNSNSGDMKIQPSVIAERLVTGNTIWASNSGISEYFTGYRINIDHSDEEIEISKINIQDGPLHDIFFGKKNTDGTLTPSGLVSLSHLYRNIENGNIIDEKDVSYYEQLYSIGSIANRYASSSAYKGVLRGFEAQKSLNKIHKIPFICYYDNLVDSIGSSDKGSFNYVPKYGRQATNIFNYNFGNNFIDSDVLSFNVSYDCTPALASNTSLKNVSSDIDIGGESFSSNYNAIQESGFVTQSFNTASGLDEATFITQNTLANSFHYPFEASMMIVGQTDCNKLLDVIRVNVFINGVQHPTISGDYTIIGIEDEVSENGFTTTFKLNRYNYTVSDTDIPDKINNFSNNSSRAYQNQQWLENDYK